MSSTDTLTITNAFPGSDLTAGLSIKFSVSGFRNPISTIAKTGFTISTISGDTGTVDSSSTTLQATTPATIASGVITSTNTKIVQTLSVIRATFPSPVPLDAGCLIDVQFPSSMPITTTDLASVRGSGLFGGSKTFTTIINTGTRTVTITNG